MTFFTSNPSFLFTPKSRKKLMETLNTSLVVRPKILNDLVGQLTMDGTIVIKKIGDRHQTCTTKLLYTGQHLFYMLPFSEVNFLRTADEVKKRVGYFGVCNRWWYLQQEWKNVAHVSGYMSFTTDINKANVALLDQSQVVALDHIDVKSIDHPVPLCCFVGGWELL